MCASPHARGPPLIFATNGSPNSMVVGKKKFLYNVLQQSISRKASMRKCESAAVTFVQDLSMPSMPCRKATNQSELPDPSEFPPSLSDSFASGKLPASAFGFVLGLGFGFGLPLPLSEVFLSSSGLAGSLPFMNVSYDLL